ncbi:MAG: HigA family addiction module antidote protein [Proteobacteria bacterium]|nr:HigA family addiction module antidote protein [Pseudomonadota bacterium]
MALIPSHPGRILREVVLEDSDVTKTELARRLALSRQALHNILTEKARVTPEVAIRLARLLGTTPQLWLNLQTNHDVAVLENKMRDEISGIEPLHAVG